MFYDSDWMSFHYSFTARSCIIVICKVQTHSGEALSRIYPIPAALPSDIHRHVQDGSRLLRRLETVLGCTV
jgi:hypothetical protein